MRVFHVSHAARCAVSDSTPSWCTFYHVYLIQLLCRRTVFPAWPSTLLVDIRQPLVAFLNMHLTKCKYAWDGNRLRALTCRYNELLLSSALCISTKIHPRWQTCLHISNHDDNPVNNSHIEHRTSTININYWSTIEITLWREVLCHVTWY